MPRGDIPVSPHGQKALREQEKRNRVWNFVGDETNLPGEVNILGKGHGDERVVRRVDTGAEFVTRRRFIEPIPGDQAEDED